MVSPIKIKFPDVKTDVIPMDGGLNEAVSSIEMKPGELITCKNYYITEGSSGGYVSIKGYERFDGHPKPSSVGLVDGVDTLRESARTLIEQVPGVGSILGIHVFKGKVYAFRNKTGAASAGMYVSSALGWVQIDTSSNPLAPNGHYEFINYNFLTSPNSEVMIWVNGQGQAKIYDEVLVTSITNAGMGVLDKPTHLSVFAFRLFLSYLGGSLQYSELGDPNTWTGTAGEIGIGHDITALDSSVGGSLVIFSESSIKVLKGTTTATWVVEDFSNVVGAYSSTLAKIFDTLIFVNDFGATTLSAAQDFGDFSSNSISEKIKNTLLKKRGLIRSSVAIRSLNQYRLFFSDGKGIVFSFLNKKLRGVTTIQYPLGVLVTAEGEYSDGTPIALFGSSSGYVYEMDSGTSFDGAVIEHRMVTTYYHYKSPRFWKRFNRLTFEIASNSPITFNIKPSYDYSSIGFAKGSIQALSVTGPGGVWGEGDWGVMTWAGSDITNRVFYDLLGVGTNLSISLGTTSKYTTQHTVQNLITDFVILGRQL